ncbi:MAG: LemA family protein [Bacilli bacterium]|nr:LemA family protein [Bacilli bacterium]MDD4733454.1 LemA family protein [Bacilli bacterium]
MDWFFYLLILFIIICLIMIWYITTYNKYQVYIIKINEAEANIDSTLRKRFDLLNKSINIIKGNIEEDIEVMEIIVKLRSRKLTNFDLDRQLYEAINEFHNYEEEYPELKNSETFMKIGISLNESEAEITAARNYYNDTITQFNKMVKVFPSNIIARICKYKIKTYFDGKMLEDEDILKL